jgi:hypothetical protein
MMPVGTDTLAVGTGTDMLVLKVVVGRSMELQEARRRMAVANSG